MQKLERKLAKEQKILSRRARQAKKDGQNCPNRKTTRNSASKSPGSIGGIRNTRTDYLQKTSTEIVKNHDVIGIEDLHVSGMMKNKKFSKGISEASWAQFGTMLEDTSQSGTASKSLPLPGTFLPANSVRALWLPKQRREESLCPGLGLPTM